MREKRLYCEKQRPRQATTPYGYIRPCRSNWEYSRSGSNGGWVFYADPRSPVIATHSLCAGTAARAIFAVLFQGGGVFGVEILVPKLGILRFKSPQALSLSNWGAPRRGGGIRRSCDKDIRAPRGEIGNGARGPILRRLIEGIGPKRLKILTTR